MRIGVIPENPIERLVLKMNVAPEPIIVTQMAFTMARAIMAGVDIGAFDALARGPLTTQAVAGKCGTHPKATEVLLRALVGCGQLTYSRQNRTYDLKKGTRKWLLRDSEHTLSNKMLFQQYEWNLLAKLEDFIRTGKPLDLHESNPTEDVWAAYQAGMADIGRLALAETLKRTPVPKGATRMLDIGGSGGTYSAAFVKKYSGLSSRILDLPSAVVHAKPFVEKHGLGNRLEIVAGNVLEDDLGKEIYDFVFMGNVAHHLSAAQNEEVARKVFAALRKGGLFTILEFERSELPSENNQLGALMDLYFSFTSESGTWTCAEMGGWMQKAGFALGKPLRLRSAPGIVEVCATKS